MADREYKARELIPGTPYLVIRLAGEGGMGRVYEVEDTTVGRRYALKTLLPEYSAREDLVQRMRAEARTLVQLAHPNIVEVFTAGVTADADRLLYFVMELLDGKTVKQLLKQGRLHLHLALDIASDVADALERAHRDGIIHRDIKPDNIFVATMPDATAMAKLLDFGVFGELGNKEEAGKFYGTPRYSAPEQLRGEDANPRSDLYSLGCVLFEMITGQRIFSDATGIGQILEAHHNRPPPRLSDLMPGIPPGLDKLLASTLEKDPAKRVRNATTFGSEIRRIRRSVNSIDENKTLETLLGAVNRTGGAGDSNATAEDAPFVAYEGQGPAGRATTLAGIAPVDVGPPESSGHSTPARTPAISTSKHLFAGPDARDPAELLAGLGRGYPEPGADRRRYAPMQIAPDHAPPPHVPPQLGSASTEPLQASASPLAQDTSPSPSAPDSWRRVQAAMALAAQVATPAPAAKREDPMDAAKARVPLVGPAAGAQLADAARGPVARQPELARAALSAREDPMDAAKARVPLVGPSGRTYYPEVRAQRAAEQALAQLGIQRPHDTTDTAATRNMVPEAPVGRPTESPRAVHVIVLSVLAAAVVVGAAALVVLVMRSQAHPPTPAASAASAAPEIASVASVVPPATVTASPSAPAAVPTLATVEAAAPSAPASNDGAVPNAPRAPPVPGPPPRSTYVPPLYTPPPRSSARSPSDVGDPFIW